jgi:hypothetical protein
LFQRLRLRIRDIHIALKIVRVNMPPLIRNMKVNKTILL